MDVIHAFRLGLDIVAAESEHPHSKSVRASGDFRSNGTEANDPDRLSKQFVKRWGVRYKFLATEYLSFLILETLLQLPRQSQHERHSVFGHWYGVNASRITHNNIAL